MTLNLVKYQAEMLKAWKEVVDDKDPTDWALFTYDGQSYDLKLAGKGGKVHSLITIYYLCYFKKRHVIRLFLFKILDLVFFLGHNYYPLDSRG